MTGEASSPRLSRVGEVLVKIDAVLGSPELSVDDIGGLEEGRIIRLDHLAGEPIDVVASGDRIAVAEVVVIDEHFGLRITRLLPPEDSS